jgi:hypothetical protein
MRNKITAAIFILSILVLGSIGYLLLAMSQAGAINNQAAISGKISQQVLAFGMQYYDIQLAFWQYVNDPNNGRLLVYDRSKQALAHQMDELVSVSLTAGPSLYSRGGNDIITLRNGLKETDVEVADVFKLATDYETAKQSGQAASTTASIAALRAKEFAMEERFNQLDLNRVIIDLDQSQEKLMDDLSLQAENLQTRIMVGLLILAGLYMLLLSLIAIFLISLINETKRKCQPTNKNR